MGQYWDEEKGTSYNYFRDYASGLGRYIQSDPIGLNAGINTYGYVYANSISGIDFYGLAGYICIKGVETFTHIWFIIKNPAIVEETIGWNPLTQTNDITEKVSHWTLPGYWKYERNKYNKKEAYLLINNKHNCMEIKTTPKYEECILGLVSGATKIPNLTTYNVLNIGGDNCSSALVQAMNYCEKYK